MNHVAKPKVLNESQTVCASAARASKRRGKIGVGAGVGACMLTFSRKIRGRVRSRAKSLSRVLHDLIQPEIVDIRLDLDPNRQVV
jgi:hypothetical protein